MSYDPTGPRKKTWDKMKENPFVPAGVLGFFAVAIYGIKNYKNQKMTNPTAYFGSLRVMAQGMVAGAIAIAASADAIKYFVNEFKGEKKDDS